MCSLNMAYFCRLLLLVSSFYFIVYAKSTVNAEAEKDPEKDILIKLLERILDMNGQESNKKPEADVSPVRTDDRKIFEKDSEKKLENEDKKKNKNEESTLEEFDNCDEDAASEDQRLMDSFLNFKNGNGQGTKCKKKLPQDKIKDLLLLTPDEKKNMKRNFQKTLLPLWPNGTVPYVISDNFTEEEKKVMRKAFDEVENKTCIKLEPYNGISGSYVSIINDVGCYSYMGIIELQYQPQNLSLQREYGCIQHSVVIHEVLHALGMVHEQNRRDRDRYLTMNFASIAGGESDVNFRKFLSDDLNPYDLESVLQYSLWAGSTDGRPVMIPKIKDLSFLAGSATGMEFYDVKDITDEYNCTEHCKSKPVCKYSGFVDFKCECYCPSGTKGDDCSKLETDADCGGFVDVSDGPKTILSPNYPQNYSVDKQCVWMVETKKGNHVRVNVTEMYLSSDDKNCHHWLEVRYNLLAQTGRRICGDGENLAVYETTPDGNENMMMIRFNSKKVDEARPAKGFKLRVSSFEVKPCYPNPCKNGGNCIESGSKFTCTCKVGWKGSTCEEKVDPCNPNPCNNGGTCSPSGNQFTCSCSAGWNGVICDIQGACHFHPCFNGGKCSDTGGSLTCVCPSGWIGKQCDLKDRCGFNTRNEKCFMHDTWTEGDPGNFRFKYASSSDIRNNGYTFVNSTVTGYESADLYSKPIFSDGPYCFSYMFYQYTKEGKNNYASVHVSDGKSVVFADKGNRGTEWMYRKAIMTLNPSSIIHMRAIVKGKAVVAFDDISIAKGKC